MFLTRKRLLVDGYFSQSQNIKITRILPVSERLIRALSLVLGM